MMQCNRRTFLELSSAAFLSAYGRPAMGQAPPHIIADDVGVHVKATRYAFSYAAKNDLFTVADSQGRVIFSTTLQPAVVIAATSDALARHCIPGRPLTPRIQADRVVFSYRSVNGDGKLSFTAHFTDDSFWFAPIRYENSAAEDVVSLHYFATVQDNVPVPDLGPSFLTVPGICMGTAIGPIQAREAHLDATVRIGNGRYLSPGFLFQQWGLPVHYFCGCTVRGTGEGGRDRFSKGRTDTFVCGLADLPSGDLLLDHRSGRGSIWIEYRSDLWKHLRTPGTLTLGCTLCWSFGANDYEAISNYYDQLLHAGIIQRKQNSAAKNAAALSPQFCTWGAQVSSNHAGDKLDQAFLNQIYKELKDAGMQATMFSIDNKWEGRYGPLEHDKHRFPNFEQFLDGVRADGHRIGIWAAFMRCEKPADLGLTMDNMLQATDGKPYKVRGEYYILDFTQPAVEKALIEHARQFIRRYKPDLVKFDFGYEIPAVGVAAPRDMNFAGERILKKGLDVIVGAMRQENPDLVVMYYQLSPLFLDYFDLHCPDDLFLDAGDYDLEANRRLYYASILGQLGVPTYGSSGYDWSSSPSIWFDSVASGTIGSLNDFNGDEFGEVSTPARIALYNGLTHTVRPGNVFTVLPFPAVRPEAAMRGAHARSWARLEDGKVVLIAKRPPSFEEGDSLAKQTADPRITEIVSTTVPVVVASRTAHHITQSAQLAVVAYADGTATIRRERGAHAQITTHYSGGATTQNTTEIQNGQLVLTFQAKADSTAPVEWLEITIS